VYEPASNGTVGPLSRKGLLINEAVPWLLREEELPFGMVPLVVLNVTVPVGLPCPESPFTSARTKTALPKGALVKGTVYCPN
jgi:hypothetical protein